MSEPMSEADLQFIRGEKNILERVRDHGGIPNRERADWILRLLAEVERLREQLAGMARDTIVSFEIEVPSPNETIEKSKQILRDLGREDEIPDW